MIIYLSNNSIIYFISRSFVPTSAKLYAKIFKITSSNHRRFQSVNFFFYYIATNLFYCIATMMYSIRKKIFSHQSRMGKSVFATLRNSVKEKPQKKPIEQLDGLVHNFSIIIIVIMKII